MAFTLIVASLALFTQGDMGGKPQAGQVGFGGKGTVEALPQDNLVQPYPLNGGGSLRQLRSTVQCISLARFKNRVTVSPVIIYPKGSATPMFTDIFEALDDRGHPQVPSKELTVFVAGSSRADRGPKRNKLYLVGYSPTESTELATSTRQFSADVNLRVKRESNWVAGWTCVPCDKIIRDVNTPEDSMITYTASLLSSYSTAENRSQARTISFIYSSFYDMEHDRWWAPELAVNTLRETLRHLPSDIQFEALGLLTMFDKSEVLGRELFQSSVRFDRDRKDPFPELGRFCATSDEFADAALTSPYPSSRQRYFGAIGRRPKDAPSAPYIEKLIRQFDSFDRTMLKDVLDSLAGWAGRKDLVPDVVKYTDGMPVIGNLEHILKTWRESPPPIPPLHR